MSVEKGNVEVENECDHFFYEEVREENDKWGD